MSDNAVAPADTEVLAELTAPVPEVGDGGPEMVQLLTPEGQRVENTEYDHYVAGLTDEDLRGFYRDLVLIRRVDAEATALQRQGELGIWASLLGQEAAQVGSGRALRPQDYAFPTYREHGVAWCRGVDPLNLLGLFRGVNHGGWDPNEKNFHLYTIVIGAQTLHATGYAMGIQRDGDVGTGDPDRDAAVIAYFGDGASAQGDVNEAFVFAAVTNAPVVFFCQNNQWAISEPNERQTRIPLYQRARGFGFPGVRVDGNDVLAVYAVTQQALNAARSGQGPDLRRGLHLPDGRPHHLGRPDEVPRLRRGRGVEAPRPDRAAEVLPRARQGMADQDFFDALEQRGRRAGGDGPGGLPGHARPGPRVDVRPHLRRGDPAGGRRAPRVRRVPRRVRGRALR